MEALLEILVKEIQKQVETNDTNYERLEVLNRLFANISHHLRMIADTNSREQKD
jgi:hypothetical protein